MLSGCPLLRIFLPAPLTMRPDLLAQSYRLRYQVYCLERKFLPAEDYPAGLELDEFDSHSPPRRRRGCAAVSSRVRPVW